MKLKEPEMWAHSREINTDVYGKATIDFAERWANLMEERMVNGKTVGDVAQQACRDADTEGITGFMYGCAVQELAHCWEHGEALRKWHNLAVQIHQEGVIANATGGVLNPAILTLTEKSQVRQ